MDFYDFLELIVCLCFSNLVNLKVGWGNNRSRSTNEKKGSRIAIKWLKLFHY